MKAILEFNLPEDREDYELATKATSMHIALYNLGEELFRPARKHGYNGINSERLNILLEDEKVREAVALLEELYVSILRDEEL